MGLTPAPGPGGGPKPGGLARVLARAGLPPVTVPSGYTGESRPVVRPALDEPPVDGGPAAPSSLAHVVAAQQSPAAASVPGEGATLADPDVMAVQEDARTAPPTHPFSTDPGLEPEVGRPAESRPGPVGALTATPEASAFEPFPAGSDQPVPQVTRLRRSVPERPDRSETPAPAPSAPPVVIGRIEVHVDSPAAQADPFAGCRVVAAGLTARRGGGW